METRDEKDMKLIAVIDERLPGAPMAVFESLVLKRNLILLEMYRRARRFTTDCVTMNYKLVKT